MEPELRRLLLVLGSAFGRCLQDLGYMIAQAELHNIPPDLGGTVSTSFDCFFSLPAVKALFDRCFSWPKARFGVEPLVLCMSLSDTVVMVRPDNPTADFEPLRGPPLRMVAGMSMFDWRAGLEY